jgi:beta-galactosidase
VVVLHVGAAESVLLVGLNGAEVGVSKDSHLAAEFDVTAFLRPGANDLRLTVVKWSDASFIEDQDQWWHGGITRPVFLYATGQVHLADLLIDAGWRRTGRRDAGARGGLGGGSGLCSAGAWRRPSMAADPAAISRTRRLRRAVRATGRTGAAPARDPGFQSLTPRAC